MLWENMEKLWIEIVTKAQPRAPRAHARNASATGFDS
jgi:hypothetical protein